MGGETRRVDLGIFVRVDACGRHWKLWRTSEIAAKKRGSGAGDGDWGIFANARRRRAAELEGSGVGAAKTEPPKELSRARGSAGVGNRARAAGKRRCRRGVRTSGNGGEKALSGGMANIC